jgi:glucokinase
VKGHGLLADIGGTNVRFATLMPDGRIGAVEAWLTALYPDFATAVRTYAEIAGVTLPFARAAVCAAGPLEGDRIDLTNCAWKISRAEIAAATGAKKPRLVNDFAAVAQALPVLGHDDLIHFGGTQPLDAAPKVVLGPGTGLGVAGLVPDAAGKWNVVAGEGGHVDLAPANERELAIVYYLIGEYGHVSVERVLSGPGLETLYLAIAALDGVTMKAKPIAADIARAARDANDPVAVETVHLFTAWLGAVAGNLALTFGGRGGVYIAGGIVPQWGELFDAKLFRHRFEAKGRMQSFLHPIPTYLITAKDLAFRGLAEMLRVAA